MSAEPEWDATPSLVDLLLEEQQTLSAVDVFSVAHDEAPEAKGRYESLIPSGLPGAGQQRKKGWSSCRSPEWCNEI